MRRTWEIGPYQDEYGRPVAPSEDELARELIGVSYAAARWGGSIIVVPKRVHYKETGEYETIGWAFKYNSADVPAAEVSRPPEPEPERGPEPEPGELTAEELADHFPEAEVPEPVEAPEPVAAG